MSDPLSFFVLGSGVAAMTKMGAELVKAQPNVVKIKTTPLGITRSEGSFLESKYSFDDSSSGQSVIWSAERIKNNIKSRQGFQVPPHKSNNIVLFGLEDSETSLSDNSPPNSKVLWSSLKATQMISSKNLGSVLLKPGSRNVAMFSVGEPVGSVYEINDSSTDPNALWSASKISSLTSQNDNMKIVVGANENVVALFDGSGQVLPAKHSVPLSASQTNIAIEKAFSDKILLTSAPSKHLASFDSSGQVKDSETFVDPNLVNTNVVWPCTRVQSAITDFKDGIAKTINDQTNAAAQAQKFVVDPITVPSAASKMNTQPSATAGNFAVFNSSGQAVDSLMKLNDLGTTKSDVWSALKITNELEKLGQKTFTLFPPVSDTSLSTIQKNVDNTKLQTANKMNKISSNTNNLAIFDSAGSLKDGGFALSDSNISISNLWSASKIENYLTGANSNTLNQINSLKNAAITLQELLNTKMNLVSTALESNIAVFDGNGQIVDSTTQIPLAASTINSKLATKAQGVGVSSAFASWSTPTTLKSSGTTFDDSKFTTTNLLSSKTVKDKTDIQLDPFSNVDSSKAYAVYKIENWTHSGPAYVNGIANYKAVPFTVLETNYSVASSRLAYFRIAFFGAISSPANSIVSLSPESGRRQDAVVGANTTAPAYFSNIVYRTGPFLGLGVAVDPGPATIVIGYVSVVEL